MRPAARAAVVALFGVVGILGARAAVPAAGAADWPQWRGPARDGEASEFEAPESWPGKLDRGWRVEVGEGHSSPVVAGERVFVLSRRGGDEVVSAMRVSDGGVEWQDSYETPYTPVSVAASHGQGPFSTPLHAGGRLFTFGITGTLSAYDAGSGQLLWRQSTGDGFKFSRPFYGVSQSPLLEEGRLVVHVGGPNDGALVALDPASGKELWRLAGDGPAYGSPIVGDVGGTKQIVTFTQQRLIGVALSSGTLLWELPYQVQFDVTSLTPVLAEGLIVLSAGKVPATAHRIEEADGSWSSSVVWSTESVTMAYSSPVAVDGRLFCYSQRKSGQLVVLDARSGSMLWEGPPRAGENAYLVRSGGWVLAFNVSGEVEVHAADSGKYEPVVRYQLSDSPVWAYPALAGRHIFVKDETHLTRWDLP